MSELLYMDGYGFYVWGSMLCFFVIMAYDFIGLHIKKKQVMRQIKAQHRKIKHRKAAKNTANHQENHS